MFCLIVLVLGLFVSSLPVLRSVWLLLSCLGFPCSVESCLVFDSLLSIYLLMSGSLFAVLSRCLMFRLIVFGSASFFLTSLCVLLLHVVVLWFV